MKSGRFILKLVMLMLAYYLINAPFIDDRINFYLMVEWHRKLASFLLQLFLALLLVTFLSNSRKLIKWGFLIVFLINSIAYVTYYNAIGSPLTFSDFSTLFQAKSMIGDAFLGYFEAILQAILIHIPFICIYAWTPKQNVLGLKGSLVALSFYILVLVAYTTSLLNTQGRGLIGRPGFLLPTVQMIVYGYANLNNEAVNENLKPSPRANLTDLNLVDNDITTLIMVIDESINWDLIDLNYEGNVTPVLKDFPDDNLLNFGKTISYANCSDLSNASIRKFVRYGEEESDLLGAKNTYIWDVVERAGFTPYLMDSQADGVGHNYFTKEELTDVTISPVTTVSDSELINEIVSIRESKPQEKQFFLVLKKGAHLPYYNAQTEEFFKPGMQSPSLSSSTREEIINTYKNQTRVATNQFFNEALNKLDFMNNTQMIYTADHGQSFNAPGKKSFHCDTRNPDLEEVTVPLLVIGPKTIKSNTTIQRLQTSSYATHYFIPALIMAGIGFKDEDITRFTDYEVLLKSETSLHFVYDRAVPMFNSSAQKKVIEVSEIEALKPQLNR